MQEFQEFRKYLEMAASDRIAIVSFGKRVIKAHYPTLGYAQRISWDDWEELLRPLSVTIQEGHPETDQYIKMADEKTFESGILTIAMMIPKL